MKPWLLLPAEISSKMAPKMLPIISKLGPKTDGLWKELQWNGLHFRNPMGIAGGVDKDSENIQSWWRLGAGFVEVGTITPKPQPPNPGKIMNRNNQHLAVWNKMGFPSKGLKYSLSKLKKLTQPHHTPIFVNIGKNRDTPNEKAHEDYLECIQQLEPYADAFVINISSPNTKSLRSLLEPQNLKHFLEPIAQATQKPRLLKISPDISNEELKKILDISLELNISGWILTNTTTSQHKKFGFPETGGLSGKPLSQLSKNLLKQSLKFLGPRRQNKLIISAGGILNDNDVKERLEMGADLIQTYSGLIFNGPFWFNNIIKKVKKENA